MHILNCPVCQGSMKETERNGIFIDVCTQCRGVWLDRGELEKLLSSIHASTYEGDSGSGRRPSQHHRYDDDDDDHYHYQPTKGPMYVREHRKKSKLESLLDIFD